LEQHPALERRCLLRKVDRHAVHRHSARLFRQRRHGQRGRRAGLGIETDFSLKLGKFTISGSGAYNNAALTQDFCALDPATLVP
jgi:hypothetical protein